MAEHRDVRNDAERLCTLNVAPANTGLNVAPAKIGLNVAPAKIGRKEASVWARHAPPPRRAPPRAVDGLCDNPYFIIILFHCKALSHCKTPL